MRSRPPPSRRIDGDAGKGRRPLAIGCDIGGTAIKTCALDGMRVVYRHQVETPRNRRAFSNTLERETRRAATHCAAATEAGAAPTVGIALCGWLDERRRRIERADNLRWLEGCELARTLERRLERPVILDADTNAGAIAEARLGAGRGSVRMLYVTLGTGVGAALTVNGHPVRVSHHTVGQISQLPIADLPITGTRRRRRSVQDLLSAGAVVRRARRHSIRVHDALSLHQRACEGNRAALSVWRHHGHILAELLGLLNGLWSPTTIVIGGGLAGASEWYLPATREMLARARGRTPQTAGAPRVLAAQLGTHAGAIGAALLGTDFEE